MSQDGSDVEQHPSVAQEIAQGGNATAARQQRRRPRKMDFGAGMAQERRITIFPRFR